MSTDTEVTRFAAIDLGAEVPSHALQGILGDVNMAGISTPEYIASNSTSHILTPRLWNRNPGSARSLGWLAGAGLASPFTKALFIRTNQQYFSLT